MLGTNSIKMVVKKAAKYYVANKEVLREDVRKKKKIKKNEILNRHITWNWFKWRLKKCQRNYHASKKIYKNDSKTLKFGNAIINKKEFLVFKKPIALNFVDIDKIVIFDKFKQWQRF